MVDVEEEEEEAGVPRAGEIVRAEADSAVAAPPVEWDRPMIPRPP